MVRIKKIELIREKTIEFEFSDGSKSQIDFDKFIGESTLTNPLNQSDYFAQVKIYEDGRGIYWPNGLDFCADFLKKSSFDIHISQFQAT